MKKTVITSVLIFISIYFFSCKSADNSSYLFKKNFSFNSNAEGWSWDFADYPAGSEDFYELSASYSKLPSPLDNRQGSIRIRGNNHSDDLFMFIKKKVYGLKPDTDYKALISIKIASNAADGSFGIGGSPASSVYVKAGITADEPLSISEGGSYRLMNIDKGNQATSGKDMSTIGDLSNGIDEFIYRLIVRESGVINFRTSSEGNCWVILGTDSGFEGATEIYYESVDIEIQQSK